MDTTIKAKLDGAWRDGMSGEGTLDRYGHFKKVRGNIEHIHDNTKGSRLLANARAGCLQARRHRSRHKNMEATRRKCGAEEEALEHVVLECEKPADAEERIRKMIGLHEDSTPTMVFNSKRVLKEWENTNAIPDHIRERNRMDELRNRPLSRVFSLYEYVIYQKMIN